MSELPLRIFTPLTWREGRLVPMTTPKGQPITDDYIHRHAHRWWVEDGHVISTRSDRRFHFGWDTVEDPARYASACLALDRRRPRPGAASARAVLRTRRRAPVAVAPSVRRRVLTSRLRAPACSPARWW